MFTPSEFLWWRGLRSWLHGSSRLFRTGLVLIGLFAQAALHQAVAQWPEGASSAVQKVVQGVLQTNHQQGQPFVVVDKKQARVWVFSHQGRVLGNAPALLGLAFGDEAIPGLGDRPLSQIRPQERVTPAGRFVAELGKNTAGQTILWVDYDQAISLHPVRALNPKERRLERLASATVKDNRISYGCINVPEIFWRTVVLPTFRGTKGIVFVLPDSSPLDPLLETWLRP